MLIHIIQDCCSQKHRTYTQCWTHRPCLQNLTAHPVTVTLIGKCHRARFRSCSKFSEQSTKPFRMILYYTITQHLEALAPTKCHNIWNQATVIYIQLNICIWKEKVWLEGDVSTLYILPTSLIILRTFQVT